MNSYTSNLPHASKVIHPKFYKNVPSTLAYTIECVCFGLFWPKKLHFKPKIGLFLNFMIINFLLWTLKVAFFRKWDSLIKSLNLPKNYSKILSWVWNLNKLFTDMGGNFKFQAQDFFWNIFFWRLEDLKNEYHFLKKRAPLQCAENLILYSICPWKHENTPSKIG